MLDKYSVMSNNLTRVSLLKKLPAEDRKAAIAAANTFYFVEEYLDGKQEAASGVSLDRLIEAERVYERLVGAVD